MNAIHLLRHEVWKIAPKLRLATLMMFLPFAAPGGGVVTEGTEANLRSAMAGGGTVTFACDGTIPLTSTITNGLNTTVDATGHQITINGGNLVRVLYLATNSTLNLVNLAIVNGRSDKGAGVFNDGGTLTVQHCIFAFNQAVGQSTWDDGCGGALFNTGVSIIADSSFATNHAWGANGEMGAYTNGGFGRSGGSGCGGAICNFGLLTINSCTLQANLAQGGTGGGGVTGLDPYFPPGDDYFPGWGGNGGNGLGGAIFSTNEVLVADSSLIWNQARGGNAGSGGFGGYYLYGGRDGAPGGDGGAGLGAALFSSNGVVKMSNCTVAINEIAGGLGGAGGRGGDTAKFSAGTGGAGGDGGAALGVIHSFDDCRITNSTIASNLARVGLGGIGGAGGVSGSISPVPGTNGLDGLTVGGIKTVACQMANSLLATNLPGGNCSGQVIDAGGNLSSDGTGNFTNVGSLNGMDPVLGPLRDNGGPTLTMALKAGSPAIDAGDNSGVPPADQRGIPRPFGAASDIGAYEYATLLRITQSTGNGLDLVLQDGVPGTMCRLLTSTNLTLWKSVATNQILSDGTTLFQDSLNKTQVQLFYRVVSP